MARVRRGRAALGLSATAAVLAAVSLGTAPDAAAITWAQPADSRVPASVVVDLPDPAAGGSRVHHPLRLQVLAGDVNANPLVTSATPTGYSPATIKKYLGLTGTGSGQTVAIVAAYNDPTIAADLAAFDKQYGLAAPASFKKVSQTGSTSVLPATDAGWALEISLDVEWAHAIAPAASLLLVEATTSSLNNLNTAIDYAAKQTGVSVISNSWGTTGEITGETTNDSHCKLLKAVCVFSTGDSGNPGGYPAYSPFVVAVGGTTLSLATSSTGAVSVASEAAWSGSGGGVSIYEPRPSYQGALPFSMRTIPDVSYDADPATGFAVYDSTPYNGSSGWFQMGGTSAGAPQWAGILAAANQLRKAKSKAPLAGWNSTTLKSPANTTTYALTSGLSDIAGGAANGSCGTICTASAGYDAVTGLGSPRPGIDTALAAAP